VAVEWLSALAYVSHKLEADGDETLGDSLQAYFVGTMDAEKQRGNKEDVRRGRQALSM
jgi:hypothetical protein